MSDIPAYLRYEFEKWISGNGVTPKSIEQNDNGYILMQTRLAWVEWQACSVILRARYADLINNI